MLQAGGEPLARQIHNLCNKAWNEGIIPEEWDINCELPQSYSPRYVEAAWYDWWEKQGFFRPEYYDEHPPSNASTPRKNFIMVIRLPNVTGYLHLVLWVSGCDHADIATQGVVEKELMREQKLSRNDLGREKFLEEVWKWTNDKGNHIYEQIKALGSSCDWSRKVFTMDKNMSYAVEEAFILNWSCTLKSAVSDTEVKKNIRSKKTEIKGRTLIRVPGYEHPVEFDVLTYFAYPVENSKEEIIVATTRLETMLGDTAVVVHPNDERYKDLHSKYVQHPFLQRRVPILTDTMVDPAFGSGAVKVTPAHDPNDLEYGRRLNLQFITCINNDGLMSSECEPYSGKPRFDVRHQLLNDLKERGLYRDSKENEMILLICSRSKDIIEPLLKLQWYVNCKDMAKRSIGAVQDKELKILPISFELVWYKCSDDIPVGNETDDHYWISAYTYEEALDKAAQRFNIAKDKIRLTQDEDVLDTWFSSNLLPFSSFGWPMETDDFKKFFPTTLLQTGHDILFPWVARMVMMSLELTGRLPFTEVYLHAIIRNADECKMSQTLGNVINPLDFIHDISLEKLQEGFKSSKEDYPDGIPECGTDALRFAVCDCAGQGQYINLNKFRAESSRDFCNDLFGIEFKLTGTETPCDLWILSRLSYAIEQCESGFKKYQFSQITTAIYNFWLPELNDIYIEYVKKDFYPDKPNLEQKKTTKYN
ncbi:unnamed protein product [Rotaria sordida]|uniref:valine--tRNA ligase n=1 Tax=Rotaria sordida TaxID=392033 RepID=A0A814VZY6_9BILA|nr:unnamed protein product [Rotaria sordida]CAF1195551.1 unnamed protein product [Rotaria sordida]